MYTTENLSTAANDFRNIEMPTEALIQFIKKTVYDKTSIPQQMFAEKMFCRKCSCRAIRASWTILGKYLYNFKKKVTGI